MTAELLPSGMSDDIRVCHCELGSCPICFPTDCRDLDPDDDAWWVDYDDCSWDDVACDDDREDDREDHHEGPDGCPDCGNFSDNCSCFDDDPVMIDASWEEMELVNTDFEAGDRIKVRYRSSTNGRIGGKKRAVLARENGHRKENSCWKRSNRKVRKQFMRHPIRVLVNVNFMPSLEAARFEKEVERRREETHHRLVDALMNDPTRTFKQLNRMGRQSALYANEAAKLEIRDLQKANDDELASRGPSVIEVTQLYDSRKSHRNCDVDGENLQYFQELLEPHNLEDMGHEGVWNPPLPKGFGVITENDFDRWGNVRRPTLFIVAENLHKMECFREDAYEDPDRDDYWVCIFRSESVDAERDRREAA